MASTDTRSPTAVRHVAAHGSKPNRKPYRAARAFYLTLFIGACFAAFAISQQAPAGRQHVRSTKLRKREGLNDDEECRLVHRAADQCAFIKSHCPDDEAGFMAYLVLYYCSLAHLKAIAFMILISWLGLLFSTIGIAASDFFCINLSTLASILGMSESMAGVTFLAFGNGSPDVFSTFAAMNTNSGSLAVGELFGAAGFITAVVAGSMALIRPFHVARKAFIRDVGFFVVAAAFSLTFLWDGRLQIWECISMVLFYVFYVAFVVAWHWWIARRRKRRERDAAARGHSIPPGDEYDLEGEEYHDDPEDTAQGEADAARGVSQEDWSALERGGPAGYGDGADEDDEEEARERWMSELSSNMRLTRPSRSRKNTLTTVRPSLVGALEFQAVLNTLQKSRNIQTIPLSARRYSDDPTYTTAQQQDNMSTTLDPAARPPYQISADQGSTPTVERNHLSLPTSAPARTRAVSTNDAPQLRTDSEFLRPRLLPTHSEDVEGSMTGDGMLTGGSLAVPTSAQTQAPQSQSPVVEISLATPDNRPSPPSRANSGQSWRSFSFRATSPTHLAPPSPQDMSRHSNGHLAPRRPRQPVVNSPHDSPRTIPSARSLPRIVIPRDQRSPLVSPSSSPFPRYRDDPSPPGTRPPSLYLPPPVGSPESLPVSDVGEAEDARPPLRWWPYKVLPPPGVIVSTLFPTIYHWHEKSWWEKCLGIVAAPSVFLLTITLPVAETDRDNDPEEPPRKDVSLDSARSKSISGAPGQSSAGLRGVSHEDAGEDQMPGTHRHSFAGQGIAGHSSSATVAANAEQHHRHNYGEEVSQPDHRQHNGSAVVASPLPLLDEPDQSPSAEPWNRWLTIVQLFLAPLFVVLSIYSQASDDVTPSWLIKPVLICLLVSLVLLVPLLFTTTSTHRPGAYRFIFSTCGFIVSIAWISTIAAQVVGALKALAVILNMSHAIMGLTIFAVGNSLGDLVADITVARLGYPVMALSACFGGPMLNILLGIGVSGSYILIRGAEQRHEKHPDKGLKFKTYHIDVSNTLIVSGATLLVTLVGLLILVPLNKWVLSRKIGWALIALWTLSTIGNVVLELTGWADKGSET